jgi:alanine racemase
MKTLPAWVEIDLDALVHNVQVVRRLTGPECRILLIVKADAYGHGAVEIAREAIRAGVHMLGVATVDEGCELRSAGIDAAILLLSPALPDEIPALLAAQLRTTVPDLSFAEKLSEAAHGLGSLAPVHVEVDTGMGRSGVLARDALEWIRQLSALPGILVEGVFTHFPVSDTDDEFTRRQGVALRALVEALRAAGITVPLVHASNTAGILRVPELRFDLVRPGGMLYGCVPHPSLEGRQALRPVMSFHARLVQVRTLPPRSPISYGGDVFTCRETRLGIVPVGYGHGLSRAYSGRGSVLYEGRRIPILGRVTMDMTMIDLSSFPAAKVGDEVVLFGRQGDAEISVDEIAEKTGVIGYEVLCGISKRVVRVYRRNGGVESVRGLTGVREITSQ